VKHDKRRREPEREERRQRARGAEQHCQLQPPALQQLVAWLFGAGDPCDQGAAIDQRGGSHCERHADEEYGAQRQERPQVAAKAAKQIA